MTALSTLACRSTVNGFLRLASVFLLTALFSLSSIAAEAASRPNESLLPQPLGANDLIKVLVYNAEELSVSVRVNKSGEISLPMLDRPIPAQDTLPSDLESRVESAYRGAGILVNPKVTISVLEYASKPVSVLGAVNNPITFNADRPITLPEALTRAGGLSDDAGSYLLISKAASENGEAAVLSQRIEIADLLQSATSTLGIVLEGGEEIRVPQAGKIYVVGNVRKPGSFRIPDDEKSSVLKALALSEGLQPNTSKEAFIYRKNEKGEKSEIAVNLREVLARKSPDITLLRDDVLYIPESAKRKATMSAIEKAIAFGTATLSGVLVWGVAR